MLNDAFAAEIGPLTWPAIRQVSVLDHGGAKTDRLRPSFERSLKRAIKSLVDRGEVLILGGKGGPGDPYRYVTVECFASVAEEKKVTDTEAAKAVVAEMQRLVMGVAL
jgi:hypothetical protein